MIQSTLFSLPTLTKRPKDFNYKRDSRRSQPINTHVINPKDACQTPPYALTPLLPYLDPEWTIWEPAGGEGYLVEALEQNGFDVVSGDILTGQNFFDYEPEKWDCLVTNPPYSLKYKWLERCYRLGKPFALLIPVEALGTLSVQALMGQHGAEIMLLDKRVAFKMPHKGWESNPPFPTFWYCWRLLPEQIILGKIEK